MGHAAIFAAIKKYMPSMVTMLIRRNLLLLLFSINHISISIGCKIDPFSVFFGTPGHGETTKKE